MHRPMLRALKLRATLDEHFHLLCQMHRPMLRALKRLFYEVQNILRKSDVSPEVEGIETLRRVPEWAMYSRQMHGPMLRA